MDKAFDYGRIIALEHFTDRERESMQLAKWITNKTNVTLIAPRRWGKSSLVKSVADTLQSKKIKFVFIDLFNIRTEEEFINAYGSQVLKATASTSEELLRNLKSILVGIVPEISVGSDPSGTFEVAFNIKNQKKQLTEILDLPETIAKAKNIQVVVCIDEFQNISFFDNGLSWQKKLRAHWQKHSSCNYVLYGSQKHLMMDFFTKSSMPFYKFGELMFLEKIATNYWIPFIVERFAKTGKKISPFLAEGIATTMKDHPYFVQQYAMAVWYNTINVANKTTLEQSLDDLHNQYSILYQKISDELTNQQLNYLKVICLGIEKISSSEVLQTYKLGTSANVVRMRESLEKKELIDIVGKKVLINDPLFESWLKARYFKLL